MNIHGTIYELPRDDSGGMRGIRPLTTHGRQIFDFTTWRGLLVIAGNLTSATNDAHYVRSDDGLVGLWFGNVDDLWRFGAPSGVGGPWKESPSRAGVASDPYLMFGYERKGVGTVALQCRAGDLHRGGGFCRQQHLDRIRRSSPSRPARR